MKKSNLLNIKRILNKDISVLIPKINKSMFSKIKNARKFKKNVISFDFGSANIKIVEGFYHKGKLVVKKCVKVDTPVDSILDGEIIKDDKLILFLKRILKVNNMRSKYAICTTNSSSIINREMLIPIVKDDELESVAKYEIQQYLPINLDDYVVQVSVLGEVKDLERLNVMVIAYPKKIAESYYNLFKQLKLKPYALDVNYNALNKLIRYVAEKEKTDIYNDTIAFIDIGQNSIEISIYSECILNFTRIIKIDSKVIYGMLKYEKLEIDLLNEDEEYLNSEDIKSVIDNVNKWIESIEMTLQFYKNKNRNNIPTKLFLLGGYSKINGLDSYIEKRFNIQTQVFDKRSEINFESNCDSLGFYNFVNAISAIIRR